MQFVVCRILIKQSVKTDTKGKDKSKKIKFTQQRTKRSHHYQLALNQTPLALYLGAIARILLNGVLIVVVLRQA